MMTAPPLRSRFFIFRTCRKHSCLTKQTSRALSLMFGEDTNDWIGAKVALYPSRVDFKGKTMPTIKVRRPQKAAANSFRRTPVQRRRRLLNTKPGRRAISAACLNQMNQFAKPKHPNGWV